MPTCLIGLGSNQGDRPATFEAAAARLAAHPQVGALLKSAWHETRPIGGPAGQPPFLNGAARLETTLAPEELLALLQRIEAELGRRRGERWGPRTVDLDLLLYDELTLDTPRLVLPHPRMAWRRFALEPAAEVAPAMVHPTTGWTVARLLEHLDHSAPYLAVTGPIAAGKTDLALRLAAAIPAESILEQPDWDRLEAFYADPAGRGWAMELEFLEERARLLRRDGAVWSRGGWVVSDFWFDQSAAFAEAWLPAASLPDFERLYAKLRPTVAAPRLIVLLDGRAEELLARVSSRGRRCERRLTVEPLERIRQALIRQTHRPDMGPVLRVGAADRAAAFAEVLAAVDSASGSCF
jgi:2-amino-4-hydroxy-6-hydroxymethyldihydropteridine diphosphokinase